MYFIGDIHGNARGYFNLIEKIGIDCSIAIGDLGIGFPYSEWPDEWNAEHKFIRGNHDNPEVSRKHPNYLGDFGYLEAQDIYYISGAWSIDHKSRISGVDWWDEEELKYNKFQQIVNEVKEYRPRIIVSHDCPNEAREQMFTFRETFQTKTGGWLQTVFEEYQPTYWIFGHYHRSRQEFIGNTHFICLQELECCEIEDVKWNTG